MIYRNEHWNSIPDDDQPVRKFEKENFSSFSILTLNEGIEHSVVENSTSDPPGLIKKP